MNGKSKRGHITYVVVNFSSTHKGNFSKVLPGKATFYHIITRTGGKGYYGALSPFAKRAYLEQRRYYAIDIDRRIHVSRDAVAFPALSEHMVQYNPIAVASGPDGCVYRAHIDGKDGCVQFSLSSRTTGKDRFFPNPWVLFAWSAAVGLQICTVYIPFLPKTLHTHRTAGPD